MKTKHNIWIGTSGWSYKHWHGTFYPDGISPGETFSYYSDKFRTVEINNSFYRLPAPETFTSWHDAAPDDFLYAVKASRYITHMKKLKDPLQSSERFFQNIISLQAKLGPILFQLPPGWNVNLERLSYFLKYLSRSYRYTFEFRNTTWYDPGIIELLRTYNCAFCIYELDGHQSPEYVTADFVYVRLHGPKGKYEGSYTEEQLRQWADKCISWRDERDVFIYFDNDQAGYAAFDALRLQSIINPA